MDCGANWLRQYCRRVGRLRSCFLALPALAVVFICGYSSFSPRNGEITSSAIAYTWFTWASASSVSLYSGYSGRLRFVCAYRLPSAGLHLLKPEAALTPQHAPPLGRRGAEVRFDDDAPELTIPDPTMEVRGVEVTVRLEQRGTTISPEIYLSPGPYVPGHRVGTIQFPLYRFVPIGELSRDGSHIAWTQLLSPSDYPALRAIERLFSGVLETWPGSPGDYDLVRVWIANLDGSDARCVDQVRVSEVASAGTFDIGEPDALIRCLTWSPDGRMLGYLLRSDYTWKMRFHYCETGL